MIIRLLLIDAICCCFFFVKTSYGFSVTSLSHSYFSSSTSLGSSSSNAGDGSNNDDGIFALNFKCMVKEEMRDEWLCAIKEDQKCTRRDEAGNLQFVLGEDIETRNVFHIHEEFVNKEAFNDHTKTKHFATYDEFVQDKSPFVDEPEILFYHLCDEDSSIKEKKRKVHKPTSYCLNVNLYPKSDALSTFLKVIQNNKKGTDNTEPLALQYSYGESTEVPEVFHFHEQYDGSDDGKEGFNEHTKAPHFAAWEDFVNTGDGPFVKPPEVFFFRSIED